MKVSELRKYWLVMASMLYLAYISMMWKWGLHGDMTYWLNWSKQIYQHGFSSVYDNDCNYLPAYLYFLYFHTKIQGNLTDIQDNLYTIKYYTFIFDMLGAFAAVWFVKDEIKRIFFFLILLFNVAYIYNTVMWAQVDAIFTFFGFAAIIAALERKTILSILFLWIALNFKLQALVFIPVVGLLLLPQVLSKTGFKKALIAFFTGVILQSIVLMPFILKGNLHQVFDVITDSVGHFPYPTVGAFNLWSLVLPNVSIEGMYELSDSLKVGFLSYQQIGNLLFFIMTFFAVFPLMKYLFRKYIVRDAISFQLQNVFLTAALIALNFYFFNTQMHERYAHPAIISIAAFTFISKKIFPFILASVAYFLNLERNCWYLNLHNETYMNSYIFNPKLVASLYLILIGMLFYLLYAKKEVETEMIEL
jgi:Gpi18-like mannosyltransferase